MVEVVDVVAREEITDHVVAPDAHAGAYVLASGATILDFVLLRSVDDPTKIWKMTINAAGVPSFEEQ